MASRFTPALARLSRIRGHLGAGIIAGAGLGLSYASSSGALVISPFSTDSSVAAAAPLENPTVRIVTYNVLSPNLCSAGFFSLSEAGACDPSKRLERVKKKLREEMRLDSVLCLQEVSRAWGAELVPFFEENGYSYSAALTGGPFGGYMGQCLAWPAKKYKADSVNTSRIGDTIPEADDGKGKKKKKGGRKGDKNKDKGFWERFLATFGLMPIKAKPPFTPWREARHRHNSVVMARLVERRTNSKFVVCNYHMPCLFGSDEKCQVMTAHAALLMQHAQQWAGSDPLVVAGDFNTKPFDTAYAMIREGHLDAAHPQHPPPLPDGAAWEIRFAPMKSAYLDALGAEPEVTNFATTKFNKDSGGFHGCLDYIFHTGFRGGVRSVVPLPTLDGIKKDGIKSLPSTKEPSDHLLLAAELQL